MTHFRVFPKDLFLVKLFMIQNVKHLDSEQPDISKLFWFTIKLWNRKKSLFVKICSFFASFANAYPLWLFFDHLPLMAFPSFFEVYHETRKSTFFRFWILVGHALSWHPVLMQCSTLTHSKGRQIVPFCVWKTMFKLEACLSIYNDPLWVRA